VSQVTAEIESEGRDRVVKKWDAAPEARGGNWSRRGTDGLPRLGGIGALLSGLLFLVTVLYTFVYLVRLGLSTEMLDQPRRLLSWIATNEGAFLGLWWIYLASLLCLLPVVPTLYRCTPAAGSAIALVGAVAGLAGVFIGIVGAATNAASASALGPAYLAADEVMRAQLVVLSELFGSLQLYLRMFSDVLVALWLLGTGLAWMQRPVRWRARGGALVVLSATIAVVVASKSVGLFDLEPYLGLLTAVAYLWIGIVLLKEGWTDPSHKTT
jgi:hypothetical protein